MQEEVTHLSEEIAKPKPIEFKETVVPKNYSRGKPDKPILGYWDIRGLAQSLRY